MRRLYGACVPCRLLLVSVARMPLFIPGIFTKLFRTEKVWSLYQKGRMFV